MYGTFSDSHRAALRPFVRGREVHDIGAGDGERAYELSKLGAAKVIAVEPRDGVRIADGSNVEYVQSYARDYAESRRGKRIDVLYLAWPTASMFAVAGYVELIKLADIVVYVGCNTQGTACGNADMFAELARREVLVYRPERANTLIVYGEPCEVRLEPYHEEYAAVSMQASTAPLPYSPLDVPLAMKRHVVALQEIVAVLGAARDALHPAVRAAIKDNTEEATLAMIEEAMKKAEAR